MNFSATDTLYVALAFYALGTLVAMATLLVKSTRAQGVALYLMIGGFAAHTMWIGTICARTGHPPLTNLPEVASFIAWSIFAVELGLYIRYKVYAASFFVYPLVLLLLTLSAVVHEHFAVLDPALRSNIFIAHLLLSTLGAAGLLIGLAFTVLVYLHDRSLRSKTRGRLWEMIPSLSVCRFVAYRSLAIGFIVYTVGLLSGIIWSYRTNSGLLDFRSKQIGAVVAWVLFAVILQSYISGSYRARRAAMLSAGAFIAIVIAILGIQHG
jgi:ABC-type uncharacterized transport system permease subunit